MTNLTNIETRAEAATKLPSFPINLYEIREQVRLLLSEVQRYGFFNEYTNHNFDHVESMLNMANWIIPEQTKSTLQPADYLLLTLSIYFHDLGLLISLREYEQRNKNSDYQSYLKESKQNSVDKEYNAKLSMLSEEMQDKINYQEFVRRTHGTRVKEWILGKDRSDDAFDNIKDAIQGLIGKLDIIVRRDLALLCESHTIDDISDAQKYKVSMPYGNTPSETANLQYIAVILRTVDLLQITKGRAPAILYKIINPQDPISQLEWQKQGAVRTVRAAPGIDRDGHASATALSDTIQIHALFEKSDGFFGLTSYIAYAKTQLLACQEALKQTAKIIPDPPLFPWKHIDDSGVEAEGFLTKAFGFKLDQQKILDLLTGHTLYNDTNVVIRELTQNALDAVRLQAEISGERSESIGRIDLIWDSKKRTLEVKDNGTGMSQDVIEAHLLKVGSSRYQDPKFREEHPNFSSISRFGIGVLSAFMVADHVEITTCSVEDDEARQISLRSVHGKYLIKLLDKTSQRNNIGVYPHGSSVKLTLRTTATIGNVLEVAKMWLLFPRCKVTVTIDGNEPVSIGYDSPKAAVEHQLESLNFIPALPNGRVEVREAVKDGVTLAYAVVRDELYKDWSFVMRNTHHRFDEEDTSFVATCIEGVGVDFNTPGFRSPGILAIANIVGNNAPKTNVARSAIEETTEYKDALQKIYELYTKHIHTEIKRLSNTNDYSMSRAVEQAPYIAAPLVNDDVAAIRLSLLEEELKKVPFIILEENGNRTNISFSQLCDKESFWTINSSLNSSVEFFVREAPKDISAAMILESLQDGPLIIPEGAIFCNFGNTPHLDVAIRKHFEPGLIEANESARKVTMRWDKIKGKEKWINSGALLNSVALQDRRFWSMSHHRDRRRIDVRATLFSIEDIDVVNLDGYSAVISDRHNFLHPDDPVTEFLRKIWLSQQPDFERIVLSYLCIFELMRSYGLRKEQYTVELVEKIIMNSDYEFIEAFVDLNRIVEIATLSADKIFNPFAWKRRAPSDENQ
ncbi:ATP-binding protein [Aeromonas caviae]|uniref:HD domain-containing protein n=1 Tax=Aeromonas caviae TaxID=648 RepID=UPI0029D7BFFD|nr:ATP-binding protein [Aeromonas caviae]MDX7798087.1 ATP-binding protein [Aeromonas caviae]